MYEQKVTLQVVLDGRYGCWGEERDVLRRARQCLVPEGLKTRKR
jgi:hypothetical protein